MNPRCAQHVAQAIGRPLTPREIRALDDSILDGLRQLARANAQQYAAMSGPQRLQAAAQLLQRNHLAEADLRRQRAHLAILAQSSRTTELAGGIRRGLTGARSLGDVLERADIYVKGVAREYFSNLVDTIHAIEPRFLGLIEDVNAVRPFVHEVLNNANGSSGSTVAQRAARAWLDTANAMRERFNRAGGDVGRLDYGYLPQAHEPARVRAVSADDWANQTLPLLDRSRYVDLAGRQLGDVEMLDMLRGVHETISTGGITTQTPGAFRGTGARANHGAEHRALHFANADAYIAYNQAYGRASVFGAMQSHVTRMGRDIGLVEHMGPNPNHTFSILNDLATQADRGVKRFSRFLVTNDQMWDVLNGTSGAVEHQRLADIAQGARNIEVFGKLQGALLSSITDMASYFVTTRFNRVPFGDAVVHLVRSYGSDSRHFAERAGLISEGLIADMNRWNEANLREGWTAKLSNVTMKVSLLQGWTDAIRRGFSTAMMGGLARVSRQDWARLDVNDRARLEAKGVTPMDFRVWQLATPADWRGVPMLTPESIRTITDAQLAQAHVIAQVPGPGEAARVRDQAVSRLLGVVADESEYAAIAPNLHGRTITTWGGQKRGTMGGELGRSVMLFKGFPIAMLTRHLSRIQSHPMSRASRVGYTAQLITTTTLLGALTLQIKDLVAGKDPRNMNPLEGENGAKFWAAAMMQGGGYGFAGDILYQASGGNQSQSGVSTASQVISSLAGPVFGSGAEFLDLTLGNLGQAAKGKDTHAGAEAIRFARAHTPFVNLWYARSAIDHAVLNDLQELMSPGYLAKMERRVQRDWGQSYYWAPNQLTPDRGPDFERALGP